MVYWLICILQNDWHLSHCKHKHGLQPNGKVNWSKYLHVNSTHSRWNRGATCFGPVLRLRKVVAGTLTVEALVRSASSLCRICCNQSDTATGLVDKVALRQVWWTKWHCDRFGGQSGTTTDLVDKVTLGQVWWTKWHRGRFGGQSGTGAGLVDKVALGRSGGQCGTGTGLMDKVALGQVC